MQTDKIRDQKSDEKVELSEGVAEIVEPSEEAETITTAQVEHLNRSHVNQDSVDNSDYEVTPVEADRDHIRQDEQN